MAPSKPYFPETYLESRDWFRAQLGPLRRHWPEAEITSRPLHDHPDLSIDWIKAPGLSPGKSIFIISTGLHGTEGFTGTAVLQHFIDSYPQELDPRRTGLLLIHAMNPWGMQNRRRTNPHNVDLNRNFRFGPGGQVEFLNPGYPALQYLLHPRRSVRSFQLETVRFVLKLLVIVALQGRNTVKEAALLGQLDDPQGPNFAGYAFQEESSIIWDLLTTSIKNHSLTVHIDVHTGYGASKEMTLVNSVRETVRAEEWSRRFEYPLVVSADPESFYSMQGDLIDALYAWGSQNAAQNRYYGTAFEFGTMGDGLIAQIRSLRAIVLENQIVHEGSGSVLIEKKIGKEFRQLFDPTSTDWRQRIQKNSSQALTGILHSFNFTQVK